MNQVPYNPDLLSRKIIKKILAEKVEAYTRAILKIQDGPKYIKLLEKRAEDKGYTFEHMMTNEEFKNIARKELGEEKSRDPLELSKKAEDIKTEYVQHFNLYQDHKKNLLKVDEIIEDWELDVTCVMNLKSTFLQKLFKKLISLIGL